MEVWFLLLVTNKIMGKQSRRNRHSKQQQRSDASLQQPRQIEVTLNPSNPEDAKIIKLVNLKDKWEPLVTENIGREPSTGSRAFFKYECRRIRQVAAEMLRENLGNMIQMYVSMKIGKMPVMPLDVYYYNNDVRISTINFLTYLHNDNVPKATVYYRKWKSLISSRIDKLMFGDCSAEFVEVNGKRVDADKDEAVRLYAERIKKDIDAYTLMWFALPGTKIPE